MQHSNWIDSYPTDHTSALTWIATFLASRGAEEERRSDLRHSAQESPSFRAAEVSVMPPAFFLPWALIMSGCGQASVVCYNGGGSWSKQERVKRWCWHKRGLESTWNRLVHCVVPTLPSNHVGTSKMILLHKKATKIIYVQHEGSSCKGKDQ